MLQVMTTSHRNAMSTLFEFQREFSVALLQPDSALRERLGEGFAVYQNTVVKGLVDVLRANYPTVERLVGAEWFDAVARLFAREHLPSEPALALYGAAFPNFTKDIDSARELAYLPAVARLDRLWTEAHFATDAAPLQALALRALSPTQLQMLRLRIHPAARSAWLPHSAVTIWLHNRSPATSLAELEVSDDEEGVLITRPAGDIRSALLTRADYLFLQQLDQGVLLGDAATTALEQYPDADVAAMLAKFITAGAFAAE